MIDTNDIRQRMIECDVSEEDILAICDEIDRLRADIDRLHMENAALESFVKAGAVSVPKPQGKTVRVKVAVAVDEGGYWRAEGWDGASAADMKDGLFDSMEGVASFYWLTADLPIPEETTVEAEVHAATPDENAISGGRG